MVAVLCAAVVGWFAAQERDKGLKRAETLRTPEEPSPLPAPDGDEMEKPDVRVRQGASAAFRVVGPAQKPVPGAQLSLRPMGGEVTEYTADATGALTLELAPGDYIVETRAAGFRPSTLYRSLPADVEVRLERGAQLTLVRDPGDRDYWAKRTVRVVNALGAVREVMPTEERTDAGTWAPGTLRIYETGRMDRLLHVVAMPEKGAVAVPVRPAPTPDFRFRVIDARSRADIATWSLARCRIPAEQVTAWTPLEAEAVPGEPGVFAVQAERRRVLLRIESEGYAPALAYMAPAAKPEDIHEIVLDSGAGLTVKIGSEHNVRKLDVYYAGPAGGGEVEVPVTRRFHFRPVAAYERSALDILADKAAFPPVSRVASRAAPVAPAVRVAGLPSQSWLAVVAVDAQGQVGLAFARTGAPGSTRTASVRWRERVNLEVELVGTDGKPLPDAVVDVGTRDIRSGGDFMDAGTRMTDQDGILRLRGLEPRNTYQLGISGTYWRTRIRIPDHVLADGEPRWRVTVRRPGARTVSARILDADGRPLESVWVAFPIVDGPTVNAVTDADGRAEAIVPRGERIQVVVRRAGSREIVWKDMPKEGAIELQLEQARPGPEVRFSGAEFRGSVKLEVLADGAVKNAITVFVEESGTLGLPKLPEGSYRLRVTAKGKSHEVDFFVDGQEPVQIPVELGGSVR